MGLSERFSVEEADPEQILKQHWPALIVVANFAAALWLRYRPEQGMEYLQALDPYMIFRMSQHLALSGNLPQLDFLRYFPYAAPTYSLNQGNIFIPSFLWEAGPKYFFSSYMEWAQFYPALMGGFSVVMAYFLGKEVWDKYAGVSASFFLAVISGAMHRTSAGFFEKEPIGTFLMMVSLYFFVRAWKREERISGIFSGLALGFFTISWGGSRMLWLLYPLTVGTLALIDVDIKKMIIAYTPTILIGAGVAASLNHARFTFSSPLFIANIGLLGLLWIRYSVEELDLVEAKQLPYIVPGLSVLGGIALVLSPLYSDFLARMMMGILNMVNQAAGGDVIAGTVAENTPASLGQLVTQLGATSAFRINGTLGLLANIGGTWPLAFIGVPLLGTVITVMVGNRFNLISSTLTRRTYYKLFIGVLIAWFIGFGVFFQSSVLIAAVPALMLVIAGFAFLYAVDGYKGEINIEPNWYMALPFFWALTNILAAVTKSRLVFLATFPTAIMAGYAFSRAIKRMKDFDFEGIDPDNAVQIRIGLLAVVVLLVFSINFASGMVSSDNLGGSPNSLWMDNLEYMEANTSEGSVMLSWWDYGYWFESIGRRAAVADGGNQNYYSNARFGKVNYPLADFLTSTDPDNHTEILDKHSVDYIVLDSTMIGKYQAVSQIAHRDNNEFNFMQTGSSRSVRTGLQNGTATYNTNIPQTQIYVSLESNLLNIGYEEAPILESPFGRGRIDCVLTEEGRQNFNVSNVATLPKGYFGRPASRTESVELCLAEHPFYSFARGAQGGESRLVMVPKSIADSTLVRLYLMNGQGLDYVEPVPEGSNGYVRMWEVTE